MKRGLQIVAGVLLFNVGAGIVFAQFERFAMRAYRIPSSGMESTLHCARPSPGCEAGNADRVLVPRWPFWTPSRGDIVVLTTPPLARLKCGTGGTFVKRLIGLPGETVSVRSGRVSINGKPLGEPYLEYPDTQSGSWRVPRGEYFFMGDNRAQSCDSREWGSVPRKNLIGPVVVIYWPFNRFGLT